MALSQIEQKGITFDHEFCYSFSFSSSLFFRGKRKGENNNRSCGQKSCLSARSLSHLSSVILLLLPGAKFWTYCLKTSSCVRTGSGNTGISFSFSSKIKQNNYKFDELENIICRFGLVNLLNTYLKNCVTTRRELLSFKVTIEERIMNGKHIGEKSPIVKIGFEVVFPSPLCIYEEEWNASRLTLMYTLPTFLFIMN